MGQCCSSLDEETIDRAIDLDRPLELVRRHDGRSRYRAFVDPSAHRGGRDTVDHPRRGSDDLANALCGCAALSSSNLGFDTSYEWLRGPTETDRREFQRAQLMAHIMKHAR